MMVCILQYPFVNHVGVYSNLCLCIIDYVWLLFQGYAGMLTPSWAALEEGGVFFL